MKRALLIPLLLGGLVACGTRTSVGPITGPRTSPSSVQDTLPKSASLVRRLAEAADGFRDGKPRYVVANRMGDRGHHEVLGVFMTFAEADFAVRRAGSEYAAFGPFATRDDPADQSSSDEDVVEVIVRRKNGEERTYGADSVDALFWSLAAFDKFIAPYLTSVDGARYAAEQRELYRINKSPLTHSKEIPHKAGSF